MSYKRTCTAPSLGGAPSWATMDPRPVAKETVHRRDCHGVGEGSDASLLPTDPCWIPAVDINNDMGTVTVTVRRFLMAKEVATSFLNIGSCG